MRPTRRNRDRAERDGHNLELWIRDADAMDEIKRQFWWYDDGEYECNPTDRKETTND